MALVTGWSSKCIAQSAAFHDLAAGRPFFPVGFAGAASGPFLSHCTRPSLVRAWNRRLKGEPMHIHGDMLNINAASFYATEQQQRNIAARRAAETRKRLLQVSEGSPADSGSEEDLLSRWLHGRHTPLEDDGTYRP